MSGRVECEMVIVDKVGEGEDEVEEDEVMDVEWVVEEGGLAMSVEMSVILAGSAMVEMRRMVRVYSIVLTSLYSEGVSLSSPGRSLCAGSMMDTGGMEGSGEVKAGSEVMGWSGAL